MTSRMESACTICMTRRSSPYANPACGGTPYLNASNRNPNCSCARSLVNPSTSNIFSWMSSWWIRTEPPPSSVPFNTMSYAFARILPGSESILSQSSSIGMVNGWCIAIKRFSSSDHSNSGNSVTHKKLYWFGSSRSNSFASSRRSAPSTFHTILFLSAANNNKSPGSPCIAETSAFNSSSVMNFAKEDL